MTEILALLQNIVPLLELATFRQMSKVIFGMLVVSGRITVLLWGCSAGQRNVDIIEPSSIYIRAYYPEKPCKDLAQNGGTLYCVYVTYWHGCKSI